MRRATERFLYIIGVSDETSPVKLGIASNLSARLREVQTGNSLPLRILFSAELDPPLVRRAERACHRRLEHCRLTGEWFGATPQAAIAAMKEVINGRLWETPVVREQSKRRYEPGLPSIQVRLPLDLKAELESAAQAEERDVSFWVRRAIKEALDRRKKKL